MPDNSLDILSNTQDVLIQEESDNLQLALSDIITKQQEIQQYMKQMKRINKISEDTNINPISQKYVRYTRYANRNIELSAEGSDYENLEINEMDESEPSLSDNKLNNNHIAEIFEDYSYPSFTSFQ
ncbi:14428_t:CDS:2, partial [Funneliformis geosporum]